MSEMSLRKPLCFVAMPFGTKERANGSGSVDFDAVYSMVIEPAVLDAGMEPLRADAEQTGGIIHKAMFERLVLSEYVVADLTEANANVFYELGVRHAVRPHTSILIAANGNRLPFDLSPVRVLPYELSGPAPADVESDRTTITSALRAARESAVDSPVFQLLDGYGPPNIERLRTDSFRDRVEYSQKLRVQLKAARRDKEPRQALQTIRDELGAIEDIEIGIAVDLLLSYRDIGDHQAMVDLVGDMPVIAQRTPIVREQLGFAQNRLGDRDAAIETLTSLIEERGPSSETLGLLGRVYKDKWLEALAAGQDRSARGYLQLAIETYVRGFESDWRDAYPGINAVTLLTVQGNNEDRVAALIPVVTYSAQRRVESRNADYWDYATLLEAAVLSDDAAAADDALDHALALVEAQWQPETTLNNLNMIIEARTDQGSGQPWYADIVLGLREVLPKDRTENARRSEPPNKF